MLKRIVFFAAILILATTGRAHAQQVDSCFALFQNVYTGVPIDNPDSVMVDTCGVSQLSLLDPAYWTWDSMYAKRYWSVIFQYHVISLDSVSSDSILIVPWTAIDTAYPEIRAIFEGIDNSFGGVRLIKQEPQIADSNFSPSNEFLVTVGNYSPVDSILYLLNGSPLIRAYFNSRPFENYGLVHLSPDVVPLLKIWPQPCNNELFIQSQ